MTIKQVILLVMIYLTIGVYSARAEALPESAWYSIVYQPETDTLHWVNVGGEQASMQRPALPNESEFIGVRISPNGRYGVFVSHLLNDVDAVGIYDFQAGSFLQIHEAQAEESIQLGAMNIFTANSQYFALGFMSGDFGAPEWRVILFDSASGTSVVFIDHTFPGAPDIGLSAPLVQYIDGGTVHIVFQAQAVGGWIQNYPAFAWQALGGDPQAELLSESPYNRPNIQVLPLTGEIAQTYIDDAYPIAAAEGQFPNYNVVGRSTIGDPTSFTAVHNDGTRYLLSTRWAKGGEWILFLTMTALPDDRYWGIVLADGVPGDNSYFPLDPQYTDVFGTTDGYIVMTDEYRLFFTNGFLPNTALNIFDTTAQAKVVYVTPIGASFSVDDLANADGTALPTPTSGQIANPAVPATATPIACNPPQATRLSVGVQARVLTSIGGLNIRQNPDGTLMQTLAPGATFSIIDGPQCIDDLYWWQIDRPGLRGWAAEGVNSGYLMEPYNGPASDGLVPITETPTVTPTQLSIVVGVVVMCPNALPQRLSVGGNASVITRLTPYQSPNTDAMGRFHFPAGTVLSVVDGPRCADGQWWWQVAGNATSRIGAISPISAWVSEGSGNTYYLSP